MVDRSWHWYVETDEDVGNASVEMFADDDYGIRFVAYISFSARRIKSIEYNIFTFFSGEVKFDPAAGSMSFPGVTPENKRKILYRPAMDRILSHLFFYLQDFEMAKKVLKKAENKDKKSIA